MTLEHFKLPRDDWYDITNWDYIYKEVYDPSKFTVVGSPTITDDGVASGFSDNGYITIPFNKTATNFKIYYPFKTLSTLPTISNHILNGAIKFYMAYNGGTMEFLYGTARSGNVFMSSISWKPNTNYCLEVIRNGGNTVTFNFLNLDNNKILISVDLDVTNVMPSIDILQLSKMNNMSIDLKLISITVDGKEVFKGTKTVQEKAPPKGEIVGRLYKEALIENFNAIEAKLNELSGLTAYETQVPDFSNYNYEDVTLDSPNNKVVNLQSFLKIMNLIGVPIECRFTGKLCNKVTYYDKNMRYHTIVNQKLDNLGVDGKVYIVLDSSNDTVSAVSDITDLTNKFLLGVYDNGRVYNLRSTGLVDINILTHLCDMSVEPFFVGSLNGTKATEGIYRNGRIVGAWGRESKGAYPKDITLFDIGRQ